MRAVSIHTDALVLTSRIWQTNAVALRAGSEAMLVDSPYLPDELGLLPAVLDQAGFKIDALLATHADFDHLLGRMAFPGLALGVGEPTMLRLRTEPGAAQRELRDFDAELYVKRDSPLALGQVQSLPVPGVVELGDQEVELHPADGHTADGTALLAPWLGVLIAGDYLSDVEIPMISPGGSLGDYQATLARLAPLIERAETIVPGHGSALGRADAMRVLEEDASYLTTLSQGQDKVRLPAGRESVRQRQIHTDNVAACSA